MDVLVEPSLFLGMVEVIAVQKQVLRKLINQYLGVEEALKTQLNLF
jgi:hypothetical protein